MDTKEYIGSKAMIELYVAEHFSQFRKFGGYLNAEEISEDKKEIEAIETLSLL